MADWCENCLKVEGPKGAIEELLKFAAGESPFDFNRFFPYPEEFQRLDEITEAWDREHAGRPDCDWHARPKDGFNSGGCEWRVANWGTECLAFQVEKEGPVTGDGESVEVSFQFYTAWEPPKPVIKRASELFPVLRFELRYMEGGVMSGLFCCSGGEIDESDAY